MRSLRLVTTILVIAIGILTLLYASLVHFSRSEVHQRNTTNHATNRRIYEKPMGILPLNEIYRVNPKLIQDLPIDVEESVRVNRIDTPGCQIPIIGINYKKSPRSAETKTCGERAVFLKRHSDDKIQISINDRYIRKLIKTNSTYHCCYSFYRTTGLKRTAKIRNTACKNIKDGDTFRLEGDFISVKCYGSQKINKTGIFYQDIYPFCRKLKYIKTTKCENKINVLMIGMDSMSLERFTNTMRRTNSYLQDNGWLCFLGYHKIEDETFPNLMAALTGLDLKTISEKCSQRMDSCNDLLIWEKFKKAGYVTAYGEDYLRLPETFSKNYTFTKKPTHHYMKPFYLKGEREINNKSLLCAGKVSSGQQLLDYAYDFALAYRKQHFFGFFWMNSFSHNENQHPEEVDALFENFFNRLSYTGVLQNTLIIFLSDHGIRFGKKRLSIESYYDNRLPFLFMRIPTDFRWKYARKLRSLIYNQFRLITPYDLYDTLNELNEMAMCRQFPENMTPYYHRQSLFDVVSANRTCPELGIGDKWCSCHNLYPLDVRDIEGIKAVHFVIKHIKNKIKGIKTSSCTKCANLALNNVTRIHFYYDKEKMNLYYVVAFSVVPGNVFYEATILRRDSKLSIIGPVSIISSYSGFGNCSINPKNSIFCVCQKISNCIF